MHEGTPLGVDQKVDAGDVVAEVPLTVQGMTSLEKNNQTGPNSAESKDQFELVKTRKTGNEEPSAQSGEGGGLPL